MKIFLLTVSSFPEKGGIADFYNSHKRVLFENGFTVKSASFIQNPSDDIIIIRKNPVIFLKTILACLVKIKKFKPQIIHVHDPRCSIISILPIFFNCKKIISTHGLIFHESETLIKKIYFKFYMKFIFRFYDKILTVGNNDFELLKEQSNVELFENPIDTAKFKIKPQLKKSNEYFKFLFVGRNSKNKNLEEAITWFQKNKRKKDKFYIVTDKFNFDLSCNSIEVLTSISNKQLGNLYNKANFFLFPSSYEGFGLAVFEAMYFGVIPIVKNIPAFKKINKFYLDFDSVVMKDLLTIDKDIYSTQCNNYIRDLSWDIKVKRLIKMYENEVVL